MLNYLVKEAKYIDDHKVWLAFADGLSGEVDLGKTLNGRLGVFAPLQDVNFFKNFEICGNTLAWKNEADFAPEFLYELLLKQQKITKLNQHQPLPNAPEISSFLGITISMHYDKNTTPCFYAKKGKYEITVQIEPEVMDGEFRGEDLAAVFDWLDLHKAELLANWNLAAQGKTLNRIEPLTNKN